MLSHAMLQLCQVSAFRHEAAWCSQCLSPCPTTLGQQRVASSPGHGTGSTVALLDHPRGRASGWWLWVPSLDQGHQGDWMGQDCLLPPAEPSASAASSALSAISTQAPGTFAHSGNGPLITGPAELESTPGALLACGTHGPGKATSVGSETVQGRI